ncbi:hypothetical protein CAC02_02175 [Streptococcus gallolyticus]|uniref:Polymerase n=1 Tax=Streptococcus gallolyticus TaxID=315405 RepID=A0A368UFY4_9STRE|nr:hypothetical protein [Streptococcus gallolyticus]RCW17587.1 hypothetical protein CAC02_02175 [Streptococcus gallolyticus]
MSMTKRNNVYGGISMLSLMLFIVISMLTTTLYFQYFKPYFYYLILIPVIILIVKEILERQDLRSLVGWIVITILFFIFFKASQGTQYLIPLSVVVIYTCRYLSFEQVAKTCFYTSVVILLFVVLSSKIGIITDYLTVSSGRLRHFLGFRYALYPSTIMCNITMLYIYLKKDKIHIFSVITIFLINFWFYRQTDSRLTFYTACFVIVIALISKYIKFIAKFRRLSILLIPSYILMFLSSYWLSAHYNSWIGWQSQLNHFLGSRLSLAHQSLEQYGFSLFGQKISWIGNGLSEAGIRSHTATYTYVDSMYISLLQRYGILTILVFLILATLLLYKLYRRQEYFLMILMSSLAFHGLIDDLIIYLHYNSFWLLFALLINKNYIISSKPDNIEFKYLNI